MTVTATRTDIIIWSQYVVYMSLIENIPRNIHVGLYACVREKMRKCNIYKNKTVTNEKRFGLLHNIGQWCEFLLRAFIILKGMFIVYKGSTKHAARYAYE